MYFGGVMSILKNAHVHVKKKIISLLKSSQTIGTNTAPVSL